jgi:lysophospholipase L1-like esterase
VRPDTFLIPLFYIVTVVGAVLVACLTKWSSRSVSAQCGRAVVAGLIGLLVLEVSSLIALRVNYGYWLYSVAPNPNAWLFAQHPNMVALMLGSKRYVVEDKGRPVVVSHNSLGFRGGEFPAKGSATRVVAIGGSTTYGVDVSDDSTWPALLQDQMGAGYEVLNLGVAGHATAEHLYMMGAVASRLEPDVVILHIGLNDMHCMHSPEITPLVNTCHSDLLYLSTGRCFVSRLPRLAMIHALVSTMQNIGFAPRCPDVAKGRDDYTTIDERVLKDFKARTAAIISAALGIGARVIVVPQVGFRQGELAQGTYRWWTPYLNQSSLPGLMKVFNQELRTIAQRMRVAYVDGVDQVAWTDDLYIDVSHLGRNGNERLASLIAPEVRKVASTTGDKVALAARPQFSE